MNPEMMEKAREARGFASLTEGILAACELFGPVHSFKMVHNRGTSSVACIIELEHPKQQPALARALGGRAFESGSRTVGGPAMPAYHAHIATRQTIPPLHTHLPPFVRM